MKNWKTLVLLTVAVMFLASDFAQAQWWWSRPRQPAVSQTVIPQIQRQTQKSAPVRRTSVPVISPQTQQQPQKAAPLSHTDDGWSAWKKLDQQALTVFNKGFASEGRTGNDLRGYEAQKYRVNGNSYQFQYHEPLPGNGKTSEHREQTREFFVNPDGSVKKR